MSDIDMTTTPPQSPDTVDQHQSTMSSELMHWLLSSAKTSQMFELRFIMHQHPVTHGDEKKRIVERSLERKLSAAEDDPHSALLQRFYLQEERESNVSLVGSQSHNGSQPSSSQHDDAGDAPQHMPHFAAIPHDVTSQQESLRASPAPSHASFRSDTRLLEMLRDQLLTLEDSTAPSSQQQQQQNQSTASTDSLVSLLSLMSSAIASDDNSGDALADFLANEEDQPSVAFQGHDDQDEPLSTRSSTPTSSIEHSHQMHDVRMGTPNDVATQNSSNDDIDISSTSTSRAVTPVPTPVEDPVVALQRRERMQEVAAIQSRGAVHAVLTGSARALLEAPSDSSLRPRDDDDDSNNRGNNDSNQQQQEQEQSELSELTQSGIVSRMLSRRHFITRINASLATSSHNITSSNPNRPDSWRVIQNTISNRRQRNNNNSNNNNNNSTRQSVTQPPQQQQQQPQQPRQQQPQQPQQQPQVRAPIPQQHNVRLADAHVRAPQHPLDAWRNNVQSDISQLLAAHLVRDVLQGNFRTVLELHVQGRVGQRRGATLTAAEQRTLRQQIRQSQQRSPMQQNHHQGPPPPPAMVANQQQQQYRAPSQTSAPTHTGDAVHNSVFLSRRIDDLTRQLEELTQLVRMTATSQLDMNRSLRQEVSALMHGNQPPPARVATGNTCVVCLDAQSDTVAVPCGHLAMCYACSQRVKEETLPCPCCRAPIQDVVRVYVA